MSNQTCPAFFPLSFLSRFLSRVKSNLSRFLSPTGAVVALMLVAGLALIVIGLMGAMGDILFAITPCERHNLDLSDPSTWTPGLKFFAGLIGLGLGLGIGSLVPGFSLGAALTGELGNWITTTLIIGGTAAALYALYESIAGSG